MPESGIQSLGGRPPYELHEDVQKIILTLISTGDSDRAVTKITGIHHIIWEGLAERDPGFCALLEQAKRMRNGGLASAIRQAMMKNIEKGNPWWAKLAINSYKLGLKDPDVAAAVKIKRMMEKPADGLKDLTTEDASLPEPPLPPGAFPTEADEPDGSNSADK